MARGTVYLALSLTLGIGTGSAPFQCKSEDPARAREETAGEGLWALCGRFSSKGDDKAAKATLDYLIERYPSSRMAARAKEEREAAHPCAEVEAETSAKAAKAEKASAAHSSSATSSAATPKSSGSESSSGGK